MTDPTTPKPTTGAGSTPSPAAGTPAPAGSPSSTPGPSPTPSRAPGPSPSRTPGRTPSPSPSPSPAPSPTPRRTPSPSPSARGKPAPALTPRPKPVNHRQHNALGVAGLDAGLPLLLLPVRIETRFMDLATGSELWLRVYPDQIHVNTHEPGLTAQELTDGTAFWNAVWSAGNPPPSLDPIHTAWHGLVTTYGSPRSAWIVRTLTPTNIAQQPAAPTPAGTAPNPAMVLPAVPQRSGTWTQAPTLMALPDAWTVVAEAPGAAPLVRTGLPIQKSLAVSLNPGGAAAFPADTPVSAGMQWMVDFPTAVTAGMALRTPLTAAQRASGFDRIFVYGLRSTDSNEIGTLQALFDNHHYTDGLAVLAQGTPTNNTPDVSSARRRGPDTGDQTFVPELERRLPLPAGSDGVALATALGFSPSATPFDHVENADGIGARSGRDMMVALWPATLGYFLRQMMAPVFTAAQISVARSYVINTVVPRGPLPAIAIGDTPYGILPTTAIGLYNQGVEPNVPQEVPLVALYQKLLPAFAASIPQAPHVVGGADLESDLMRVLGMDASSTLFRGRTLVGDQFMWNFMLFNGLPIDGIQAWWARHFVSARQVLDTYGSPQWQPRLLELDFRQRDFPITDPTVDSSPLSETQPLRNNYIGWLQTASPQDIGANNFPGGAPDTLLYKFLRQSVLLAYSQIAIDAEVSANRLDPAFAAEPELVNVATRTASVTPFEVLARPSPVEGLSWSQYLGGFTVAQPSPFAELNDLKASLANLAQLPTAELDRLLTETLDSFSHRLDVWITGVANSLLNQGRVFEKTGIHLGGFSWVENVRPAAPRPAVVGVELAQVKQLDALRAAQTGVTRTLLTPMQPLAQNGGFMHAPSYDQAAAAAVLRSGFMTHQGTANAALMAVDLSSQRTRLALWFLEGVRQGQSLAVLLGYRFEAGLHAAGIDRYIQPFRDAYRLIGSQITPSSPAQETISASNVVDGLALRTAWDAGKLPPGGTWGPGLPPPGSPDQATVIGILASLDDAMDALGDLSLAEGVFQVMKGNFGRAGGLMNAVSQGAYAPDPQIVDTPRGGIDVTHRVMTLFAGSPVASAPWSTIPATARSLGEPWLDTWVASFLPGPATVRCTASFTPATGPAQKKVVTLASLGLRPLDILAICDPTQKVEKAELEERIRFQAALSPSTDAVTITFDRTGLPTGSVTFPELLALCRALRDLIGAARPLTPQDLIEPEKDAGKAGGSVVDAEVVGRAQAIVSRLQGDIASLGSATGAGIPAALLRAAQYGVTGAIPATSSPTDPGLAAQQAAVLAELRRRQQAIPTTIATAANATTALQAIFGAGFKVVPRLQAPNASALQSALAQSTTLTSSDPVAPQRWVLQLAHVRPAIERLQIAYNYSRLLGVQHAGPPLTLGQLPVAKGDRWLALPLPAGATVQKGRVALEAVAVGNVATATTYAGLLIDEFGERIPNAQESAAVAFHYEEPKNRAPQALLLAVCPDLRPVWDDALIQATLRETFVRAQIRAVDLSSLPALGQVLPALDVPFNVDSTATISTRFRPFPGVTLPSGLTIQ